MDRHHMTVGACFAITVGGERPDLQLGSPNIPQICDLLLLVESEPPWSEIVDINVLLGAAAPAAVLHAWLFVICSWQKEGKIKKSNFLYWRHDYYTNKRKSDLKIIPFA